MNYKNPYWLGFVSSMGLVLDAIGWYALVGETQVGEFTVGIIGCVLWTMVLRSKKNDLLTSKSQARKGSD